MLMLTAFLTSHSQPRTTCPQTESCPCGLGLPLSINKTIPLPFNRIQATPHWGLPLLLSSVKLTMKAQEAGDDRQQAHSLSHAPRHNSLGCSLDISLRSHAIDTRYEWLILALGTKFMTKKVTTRKILSKELLKILKIISFLTHLFLKRRC